MVVVVVVFVVLVPLEKGVSVELGVVWEVFWSAVVAAVVVVLALVLEGGAPDESGEMRP